jgi:hypothetical protein
MIKLKKKTIKNEQKIWPESTCLTCKICDAGHETEITP